MYNDDDLRNLIEMLKNTKFSANSNLTSEFKFSTDNDDSRVNIYLAHYIGEVDVCDKQNNTRANFKLYITYELKISADVMLNPETLCDQLKKLIDEFVQSNEITESIKFRCTWTSGHKLTCQQEP